jgi:hypothetical protein
MSGKTNVISNLLFLRDKYKKEFDDQVNIGPNWTITSDNDGVLRFKHSTGGADIKIDDNGSLETNGSISTVDGITIGGCHNTCIPEHWVNDALFAPRSMFENISTRTITSASAQSFDAAIDSNTYAVVESHVDGDLIYIYHRNAMNNSYTRSHTINPIGDAVNGKVNGLALNYNGTVLATLLSLEMDGDWCTCVRFYGKVDSQWSIINDIVVDKSSIHHSEQIMFSDNGKYLMIGIPTYNVGDGAILVYEKSITKHWCLKSTCAPMSNDGAHAGFGTMAFISSSGQTIIGRHSIDGDPSKMAHIYVFNKSEKGWSQSFRFCDPSSSQTDTMFGMRAIISTDERTIFASNELCDSGQIHTYEKNIDNGTWSTTGTIIRASDETKCDMFGTSLEARGSYLIVSASDISKNVLYVFAKCGGLWVETQSFTHPSLDFEHRFRIRLCQYNILISMQMGAANPMISIDHGNNTLMDMNMLTTDISPIENGVSDIGSIRLPYKNIYSVNGVNVVSNDRVQELPCVLGSDFINSLHPVTFNWKNGDDMNHDGFISQEIEQSDIGIVTHGDVCGMRTDELIPPLVLAIQELNTRLSKFE